MSWFGSFVVPTTLASPADYVAWTGTPGPSNIVPILRACTTRVLEAAAGVFYDTDPNTGLATDTAIAGALRDATCIQAAAWVSLGIDPATGGVIQSSGKATSKRIGTASIEFSAAETQAAAQARADAYAALVPDAVSYLAQRNLLGTNPVALG